MGNEPAQNLLTTVTLRNTYSALELAELRLPGYPTSRKSWYELVEREKWGVVETPGKGPGGKRREFLPPAGVVPLIRQAQLRLSFEAYREQIAPGEPMATAMASFVNDYNAGAATVKAVAGVDSITQAQLEEAIAASNRNVVRHSGAGGKAGPTVGERRESPQSSEEEAGVQLPEAPMMSPADTTEMITRCMKVASAVMDDRFTPDQHIDIALSTWGVLRRMFVGRQAENVCKISDTDLELLARFVFNTKRVLNSRAK